MAIGWIAFACVFGGALLGMFLRGVLPEHHLSQDSKDVVKLGMGLLGTTAALVLGLLIASAKSSFDTQNTEVKQAAANIVLLDRALAQYGPETKDARDLIRRSVAFRLAVTWPEDGSAPERFDTPETTPTLERIETKIRDLSPQNDGQRWLQSRSLQMASDVQQTRWLLFGGARAEQAFKGFLRVHQLPTQVWFAAYDQLSALNIVDNARIRAGLHGEMDAEETESWLRLL